MTASLNVVTSQHLWCFQKTQEYLLIPKYWVQQMTASIDVAHNCIIFLCSLDAEVPVKEKDHLLLSMHVATLQNLYVHKCMRFPHFQWNLFFVKYTNVSQKRTSAKSNMRHKWGCIYLLRRQYITEKNVTLNIVKLRFYSWMCMWTVCFCCTCWRTSHGQVVIDEWIRCKE